MGQCPDCGAEAYARGFCRRHYQSRRKDGSLNRINVQRHGHCQFDGCKEAIFSRGFCIRHYHATDHPLKTLWRVLRSRDAGRYPPAWDEFANFIADVGEKPGDDYQLRRIVSRMPWGKENFHWLAPVKSKYGDYYTPEQRSEYAKEWNRTRRFGIDGKRWHEILAEQGGGCGVCGGQEVERSRTGERKDLSIDHDHASGIVRGLLCVRCNRGIGYFRDDPGLLRAAADYLERHARRIASRLT